ncbi:YgaP family membrane protein [Alkalibacterium olivapovliticus]|uniref:Inner membrane protein YgaP-like transmembrane domain-containing protein n=1 Tax=Alkalibacterium olivapovliticus TaxID=99907 RepID=A0A2T0W9Y4_9LACT|nr:DUF2892 domain-containing protein [Alkalibacterium olivapovliticus]PRY83511.1 Protein of unknown function (DUF2892) [Alkalibacterium olivapovliticus]
MKMNVGKTDSTIRIILSLLLLPLLFTNKGPSRWIGLFSIPLLGTALTRKCGAYALMGKSTCEIE